MKPNTFLSLLAFVLFITVILFELSDAGLDWWLVRVNISRLGWPDVLNVLGILALGPVAACIPFAKVSYGRRLSYTLPVVVMLYYCYSALQMLDYRLGFSENINHWTAREDIRNEKIQYLYEDCSYIYIEQIVPIGDRCITGQQ